ncbi:type II toxin-antitoxin system VapC family toxin [uncultured Mucilaginibacter sp.]|uniref:type II toxin-antitoxin system VapC family toxin n=1 Tax=uncultured Mucilaginibacter sp. TaxID=797541 RepID=UPI0025F1046D|nr:type II toxin-antitoxin system VapC family toxin [uncultured Mucilaginibacter sp.]
MADKIILLDTSILIDYFRKKDKNKTAFFNLSNSYSGFKISVLTEYEIYSGAKKEQYEYWRDVLKLIPIVTLDSEIIKTAVEINNELKKSNKQLAIADLFIAATAIKLNLPCATLNAKHFQRVENLELVIP